MHEPWGIDLVRCTVMDTAHQASPMTPYVIHYSRIVDLSHTLSPSMPVWPGDPQMTVENLAQVESDGYYLNAFRIGEHSGTHVGAPAHFNPGERTIDALPVESFVRPAVVINVVDKALADPDYRLMKEDVLAWEQVHGRIPAGSIVILYTGWQAKWHDPRAFMNADAEGVLHFPGFDADAVTFLVDKRGIAGLGTDTPGVDPGIDRSFLSNTRLLKEDRVHLENLANLDQLPPTGTVLVIGGLKIEKGSGSPARVLAFVP